METNWIKTVMRMKTAIVDAEARFTAQVAHLIGVAERGQDTTQEEALLTSYRTSINLLRAIQAHLLRDKTSASRGEQ